MNNFEKYTSKEYFVGLYFSTYFSNENYIKNNSSKKTDIDGKIGDKFIDLQEHATNNKNNIYIDAISAFSFNKEKRKTINIEDKDLIIKKKGKYFEMKEKDIYLIYTINNYFNTNQNINNPYKIERNQEKDVNFLINIIIKNKYDKEFLLYCQKTELKNINKTDFEYKLILQFLFTKLNENEKIFFKKEIKNNNLQLTNFQIINVFFKTLNFIPPLEFLPIDLRKLRQYSIIKNKQMFVNNKKKYLIKEKWESAFYIFKINEILPCLYKKDFFLNIEKKNINKSKLNNINKGF